MPVLPPSDYRPPWFLRNGHVLTVWPALLRSVPDVDYRRERLELPDGDFLDLDWSIRGANRLAVVSHGLEGNSRRSYVQGMVRALNREGWDALAWNYRGCGGEMNRLPRLYHNGDAPDLDAVVEHGVACRGYATVVLVGFSMGGNITLNYLGGQVGPPHPRVAAAVAVSTPCDLAGTARVLARPSNRLYMAYFLRSLHGKIRSKMVQHPGLLDDRGYETIRDFQTFDTRYTARLHGFADAADYWARTSSLSSLDSIAVPVLVLNAGDDPFLSPGCYPRDAADRNASLRLEIPKHGGHVGFLDRHPSGQTWAERRVAAFLSGLS